MPGTLRVQRLFDQQTVRDVAFVDEFERAEIIRIEFRLRIVAVVIGGNQVIPAGFSLAGVAVFA
jgi:hypothetical protein